LGVPVLVVAQLTTLVEMDLV